MQSIREIQPSDEPVFAELLRQVHQLHVDARPDVYRAFDPNIAREAFQELPEQGKGFTLLAEEDGEPAGFCAVIYKAPLEHPLVRPRRVAVLDDICVDQRFQGRGIGRLLLEEARKRAASDGMDCLELMVWDFNQRAIRFYERAGMRPRSYTMELDLREKPSAPGREEQVLQVKRLDPAARLPQRATAGSAGYDLCANEGVVIQPHQVARVKTGIAVAIGDPGLAGFVYARSGLASRHGIAPINCVGVIDSDYRGELQVPLTNHSDTPFEIQPGDRIAQLVLAPVCTPELREVPELDSTARGTGGFGSTGL